MQLGQLFGGATTSPFASDFLSNYAGGIMQATDRNIAAGPISSSPGANNPGTIKPPIGPAGDVLDAGAMDGGLFGGADSWMGRTIEKITSDEYQDKKFARKQQQNREEINQALQAKFMSDLASNAGKGAMLEGGAIGQGYTNMANILGGTRLPSPQVGGANIAMPQRTYFRG